MAQKKCFVIAPIGDDTSLERKKVDSIIKDILRPCLGKEFDVYAAHQITKPGIITSQIVEMIFDSDIIVCDLTGVNGNVMYELAIAHLKEKQVIIIAAKGTKLPFDISHQRVIFYDDNIYGTFSLKSDIENAISKIKDEPNIENPITAYLNQNRTSLISESAIKDTIKEAVFDAVKQGSENSDQRVLEKVVKNLEKPSTDKIITSYIESQKQFNANKFYQVVGSAIEKGKFPSQILSLKKDYLLGSEKNQYNFDYFIKTKERAFLVKISTTVFRVAIQKDAHLMLNAINEASEVEGVLILKVFPLIIIPIDMINPGRLAAKKVPLLKFDQKTATYTNQSSIFTDLDNTKK